jgi:predicted metalloprotease with PDZ domain
MIEYYVSSQPKSHTFTVKMVIENPDPELQSLSMGKWIPGSYLIRDYARHVITMSAQNGQIKKHNSNTWIITSAQGPLVIEYTVYAFDLSVRGAYVDDERAFLNGINLFMQVHGQEQATHRVYFKDQWKWATTLPLKEENVTQGTIYEADSYDALIDHPLQAGKQNVYDFEVEGVSHRLD